MDGPRMVQGRTHTMRWDREPEALRLTLTTEETHRIDLVAPLNVETPLVRLTIEEHGTSTRSRMVDVTLWPHEVRALRDWLDGIR